MGDKYIFGFLPLMCKSSSFQLGALNAQSFAEHIISVGNLIIMKKEQNWTTSFSNN